VIPIQWNKKLILLAFLGIILYFGSNIALTVLKGGGSAEGGLETPAVKPEQAGEAAVAFASSLLGQQAESPEAALQSDKYANGFITKYNLREASDQNLTGRMHLDYWLVSAELPNGEKLRVKVGLDTPEVLGWELLTVRRVQTSSSGMSLATEALRKAGYNPQDFDYNAASPTSSQEAASFTFTSKTLTVGEAPFGVTVKVNGDRAVSVNPELQVPQSYLDWIGDQERIVRLTSVGFLGFTAVMGIAALVLAIVNRKRVLWSRGLLLTGIFLALFLIQNFNVTQAMLMAETTALTMEALATIIMNIIIVALAMLLALAVWFSLLAGDEQLRRLGLRLWPRWRDADFGRDVFYGMGRGYLICLFILGIQQVAFLIAGLAFDSFTINDPSQSTWNMKWAFLFPASAWVAAIMEEAIYRVFGVAVLKRLFRFTFPAVLVSSFIWGLGHTGYSIFPSYTRLMEVTLLGIIFGYVFLRYGFLTAVFAHAIMDSLLMSIYLVVEQPTLPHILAAIFYVILPALIGFIIRYLHPRFGGPRRNPPEAVQPPYGVPQG
jgi:hypothetical protein